MSLSRTQIIIIAAVALVILIFGGVFIFGRRTATEKPKLTLIIWGIENQGVFSENFSSYKGKYKDIDVRYVKKNPATYENEILNALAAGTGPDIFMFKSTWLPKHFEKIVPAEETEFSLAKFQQSFPTVVEQDFAPDGVIYALPLAVDTLALYYNRDIFDTAGIAFPPASWLAFQNLVLQLRQVDASGNIIRPAAAIGGSLRSINNAADILSLLMLQAGAEMTDQDFSRVTFDSRFRGIFPGLDAADFYTQFSNQQNTYYTWNDNLIPALDNFSQGKVGVLFDYAAAKPVLLQKNRFLKFRTAPMPQLSATDPAVNYAKYWGLAVSNKSENPKWAWDLIAFLTADEISAETYLKASGNPPALRFLIQKYLDDPELGVFAKQALTARSWPLIDEQFVANTFSEMIQSIVNNQLETEVALNQAASSISDLMFQRQR